MKVKELINKLQKLDIEKEVLILYCDDNPLNDDGREIEEVFEIKGSENNEYVFIKEI